MSWLNRLVDEAKFAHDINYLGPAYVHAELAAKQLESEGKTEEAKEIRAAMLDSTVDAAMMAGLGKGLWGAGKALLRKLLAPIIRLSAGMTGGIGGMYAGDKLVHTLSDGKYDTWGEMVLDKTKGAIGSTLAHLSNPLAILGGFAGGWGANKAYTGTKRGKIDVLSGALDGLIENTKLGPSFIDQAAFLGRFGWAPKQTIPYRHGSKLADLKTFVPKHDRWDVVTHGADPYMYFVTDQSTPVSAANMMDRRVYQYTGNIMAEKPMVQIGEIKPDGVKNNSRNQLVARTRQQGADTYIMQDIEDNQVPHLNIVARFIGPEGEPVQGEAASIKWYGPTMGKTTAVKTNPNLVDIDPLLKPIRAKHAERLGLKISDPKVSADPLYKQEVADFVLDWRANPENQGKTLVASTKHLLDPQYKVEFANEPSIPDFETFAARNKARGFKETDEQLRAWYNSILELGRDLNVDNRYVSDIESGTRSAKISEAERLGIPKGERNAYLIGINADPSYYAAIGLNNSRYTQRLRDFHFDLSFPGIERTTVYHGNMIPDNMMQLRGLNPYFDGGRLFGYFSSSSYPIAKTYNFVDGAPTYSLYPIIKKPYVLQANGRNGIEVATNKFNLVVKTDQVVKQAFDAGHDGVIIKNVVDIGPVRANLKNASEVADDIITLPGKAKMTDAVTYDDLYQIIPLSQRDNILIHDIRYKQGGSIKIKKKNKGKFTASAKAAGEGVQEHAHKVMNDPNATPLQKKRANFAIQAKKWHRKHQSGGKINYLNYFK